MNLKKLDLFLHLPTEASAYSAELRQNMEGSISPPPLDEDGTRNAAITIMETISKAQKAPLEWLTLHFRRTGYYDRGQDYFMYTKMQLRRSKDDSAVGDAKYEVRGEQSWYNGSELHEEMLFEED